MLLEADPATASIISSFGGRIPEFLKLLCPFLLVAAVVDRVWSADLALGSVDPASPGIFCWHRCSIVIFYLRVDLHRRSFGLTKDMSPTSVVGGLDATLASSGLAGTFQHPVFNLQKDGPSSLDLPWQGSGRRWWAMHLRRGRRMLQDPIAFLFLLLGSCM